MKRRKGQIESRPCRTCTSAALHEYREDRRWLAYPHQAPGGAECITSGIFARAMKRQREETRERYRHLI